ncbi:MAG: cytochrome c biogenesis protein CcsA [Candidatus Dormibacteraeota bacterium]|nr:cytochrome c biogenesis protein CcsA [Candidatus Dormibacteraeota bacterium]
MFLAELGAAFQLAALVLILFSGALAFFSGARSDPLLARIARRAFYAATVAVAGAAVALLAALLTHDFALAFVTEVSDRGMSGALLAAAFYGGQEGSLLYWALVLSLLGSAALWSAPSLGPRLAAYTNGFLAALLAFFVLVLVFVASPFDLLRITPADGFGLNPVLRDGGMLIHPPFLLAGYSAFAVPFAVAMAALLAGRTEVAWVAHTRRFALLAWGLQSVGLTLGMWWAYHVLGWGGYWGWDPVENVALMPWLATTAYLHTALVQERRAGHLRAWGYGLVIGAFLLSLFGTFIVRSGVVPSVHTFAVSPIGPWFFGFLAVSVGVSGTILAWRSGSLHSSRPLELGASREGAFVLQNVLLVALTAAILWGVMLPLVSGALGRQLVVGGSYYERVAAPLFVLLLALIAIGPLLPWRRAGRTWLRALRWPVAAALVTVAGLLLAGVRDAASLVALPLVAAGLATCAFELARGARFARRLAGPWPAAAARLAARNRRRYCAYIAHAGLLVAAAGIVGSHFWQQERDITLSPGQSVTVASHTLTYQGLGIAREGDHQATVARLALGDQVLTPTVLTYPNLGNTQVTRVAIRSTPWEDVYVVLAGSGPGGSASFHVFVNPLVTWIWAGGALLVLGVVLGNAGRLGEERSPAALARPVAVSA